MALVLTGIACTAESGCSYDFRDGDTAYRIEDADNNGLPDLYEHGSVASCHELVSDPQVDDLYIAMLQARSQQAVEIAYRRGRHTLWADLQLSPRAAQWYLDRVPGMIERILDLLAIDSPWAHGTTIYLLDRGKHPDECSRKAVSGMVEQLGGSALNGVVHLCFDATEFPLLEDAAEKSVIYREELPLHELCHALRPLLHWTIEEGICEYVAIHTATGEYSRGAAGAVLFAVALDAPTPCTDDGILALTEAEASGTEPVHDCVGMDVAPYVRVQPQRDQIYPSYYPTSACGWDWLRFHFGHRTVQQIVQASVEFTANHRSAAPFPFAEAVMAATGMSGEAFDAYAARFSVPVDDAAHTVTGLHNVPADWQQTAQQCRL